MNWGDRLSAVARLRSIREQRARATMLRQQLEQYETAKAVRERRASIAAVRSPIEEIRPITLRSMQLRGLAARELLAVAVEEDRTALERLDEARREWYRVVGERDATNELIRRRSNAAAHLSRMAAERSLDRMVAARSWERRS